jgi:hypothetical protein
MVNGIISKRASSGKIKNGIWCVKMTYYWKSNYSKLQRKLSASKKAKEKNNWSRESGAEKMNAKINFRMVIEQGSRKYEYARCCSNFKEVQNLIDVIKKDHWDVEQ